MFVAKLTSKETEFDSLLAKCERDSIYYQKVFLLQNIGNFRQKKFFMSNTSYFDLVIPI